MRTLMITLAWTAAGALACRTADKAPEVATTAPALAGSVSATDADSGNVKGFLPISAFTQPTGLKPLAADAVPDEMELDDYTLPTDAAASPSQDCTKQLAGNVHATKNAVWISTNVDVTSCVNQGATNAKYQSATLSLVMLLRCPGVDLSKYDGTPYANVSSAYCQGATEIQGLLNAQISGPYTVTSQQGQLTANVTFQSATMTADGSPCLKSWSGDSLTVDACTFLTATLWGQVKDTSPSPASNLNTFELRTNGTLTGTRGHQYFTSGSYQVQIGDWKGSLTYTGADTPPTWSMSSGGSQPVTGTWQPPSAATATGTGTGTGTTTATGQ